MGSYSGKQGPEGHLDLQVPQRAAFRVIYTASQVRPCDRFRPEIAALLANESMQKFLAKRRKTTHGNLKNRMKKNRIGNRVRWNPMAESGFKLGRRDRPVLCMSPLIGVLVLVLGAGLVIARNHLILNETPSVPVGLYAASSPDTATFVTFCLPPLPAGVRHDPAVCTWSRPHGRPVLKRLMATTHRGLHLRGDTANALDPRLFGPLPKKLVRGYWRPVLTWSGHGRHDSPHESIEEWHGECGVAVIGIVDYALGNQ